MADKGQQPQKVPWEDSEEKLFPRGGAAVLEEVGQRSLCVFKGWLDKAMAHLLLVTVLQETGTEIFEFPSTDTSAIAFIRTLHCRGAKEFV